MTDDQLAHWYALRRRAQLHHAPWHRRWRYAAARWFRRLATRVEPA